MEYNSLSKRGEKMIFNNSENILTTEELIDIYIDEFNASRARELMKKGESYYKVENV